MKRFNIVLAIAAVSFCVVAFAFKNNNPTETQPRGNAVGLEIGNLAPELKLEGTDGKEISLYSLRGNVVLVDFWASWCGPCRGENPNVVKNYNQYKDKGFTVLGVSLDQAGAKDKWLKAIHDDHLTWTQVSDLKYWKNAAAQL